MVVDRKTGRQKDRLKTERQTKDRKTETKRQKDRKTERQSLLQRSSAPEKKNSIFVHFLV